jgi:ABC-type Fe3+ transport system permease subunit
VTPDGDRDDDAAREAALAAIARAGRGVRKPAPRWLWIAAIIVGGLAVIGFAIAMLGVGHPAPRTAPRAAPTAAYPAAYSGLIGLVIGAAIGVVIGYAIGRQRPSHSSRNNP